MGEKDNNLSEEYYIKSKVGVNVIFHYTYIPDPLKNAV